jgi:Family of unknown function (DUF5715)
MRRTPIMVLVLAVVFLTRTLVSPALLAEPDATFSHTPARTSRLALHTNKKPTRRAAAHTPRRAAAHSASCPAFRKAGHTRHHPPLCDAPAAATTTRASLSRQPSRLRSAERTSHQARLRTAEVVKSRSAADATPAPVAQPASLNRKGAVMPPPLRGSLASLERQNERADAEGLERIEDEADLSDRIARKLLIPIPVSDALTVNGNLPENHRYCRPWTARFLADLAHAHAAQFRGASLEVSSAVRTVEYQKHLMAVNGNAAAAEGDIVSPHLTGATIDIAKGGMSRQEIGWMRSWLLPLQAAGKIDVEEEFQQACFHISVYKSYVPEKPPASIARTRNGQPGPARPEANPPAALQPKPAEPTSRHSAPSLPGGTPALGL